MRRMACILLSLTTINLSAQDNSENVAAMKSVSASQSGPNNPAFLALDGDPETWWSADSHPLQWIEVDLLEPVDIGRINLIASQFWQAGRPDSDRQASTPADYLRPDQ